MMVLGSFTERQEPRWFAVARTASPIHAVEARRRQPSSFRLGLRTEEGSVMTELERPGRSGGAAMNLVSHISGDETALIDGYAAPMLPPGYEIRP